MASGRREPRARRIVALAAGARGRRNLRGDKRAGGAVSWQKPCAELASASLQDGSQQRKP